MQYLKGTLDHGIFFKRGHPLQLQGYTDATWGSCQDTFKSTGAYVLTLAGGAVSWCSKKQNLISLSSTESEYKALSFGAHEVVWLRQLLHEINPAIVTLRPTPFSCKDIKITYALPTPNSLTDSTIVDCDNNSAINLLRIQFFMQEVSTLVSSIISSGSG